MEETKKSIIEIETQDAHVLSSLEKMIGGYLDKQEIDYTLIIGHEKLTMLRVGVIK